MKRLLALALTLLLAGGAIAGTTLHPTPTPHPDAAPDPNLSTFHPGRMQTATAAAVNARWDNLSAGWHLDEESDGTGGVVRVEYLETGVDLTDNNTTASATGVLSNAVALVRADSASLSHADDPVFNPGTDPFTISAWGYLDAKPATMYFTSHSNGGATAGWAMRYDAGSDRLQFWLWGRSSVTATAFGSPPLTTWFHVVMGYDGTNAFIQVNGGTRNTTAVDPQIDTASVFALGAYSTLANHWDGRADDFNIFLGEAKDSDWAVGMYNGGAGVAYPD